MDVQKSASTVLAEQIARAEMQDACRRDKELAQALHLLELQKQERPPQHQPRQSRDEAGRDRGRREHDRPQQNLDASGRL
jgi:hypothetical protein